MAAAQKECYSDGCYYVFKDAWHVWGRWLLLGLLIAFILIMIPVSGYLMSISRMRNGLSPVPGCGWMFPNPYKHAKGPSDIESQNAAERPPRYRPQNIYLQYHREQMQQARMQHGSDSYSTDLGDTTSYSMDEKPIH